jgi:hypothetical protein
MIPENAIPIAFFAFLTIGAVALFSFLATASFADARRRERESYYKNEMLKKIAESQGAGASTALELLREEHRLATIQRRQGLKIGGLVMAAVGIGLLVFLRAIVPDTPVYLIGLLILLIGAALYGGSYVVTAPTE